MFSPNSTPTGDKTQTDPITDFVSSFFEAVSTANPFPVAKPTPPDLVPQILATCRLLADHLNAYTICAESFDEEAFIAIQQAERLLFNARHLAGPQKSRQPYLGSPLSRE